MADDAALRSRIEALEEENRRLNKINRVLMQRVESGPGNHGGAYQTFEYSAFLAEQVRERTEALYGALEEIKLSNQASKSASEAARKAHQHLVDAIESISDALVLYDADQRLVLANSRFRQFWESTGIEIVPGLSLNDLNAHALQSGLVEQLYHSGEEAVAKGTELLIGDGKVFRLRDGSWVQKSERPTGDGGLVVLYKDITALIENERLLREQALAKKSRVLQSTLDNLSQGVVLVNADGLLETWNQRFCDLVGLHPALPSNVNCFQTLMDASDVASQPGDQALRGAAMEEEQLLPDGRVLEIRTHPMPGGGFVNTYTDITERSRYARALEQSRQRIRLLTDAVPALIAYVDADLRFEFTNRAYEAWYGWERNAILGRHLSEVLQPHQLRQLSPFIHRALEGETVTFETADPTPKGIERYVVKSYVPSLDEEGVVQGFYVLVQDITERRRTAEELKRAYQHLEQRVAERTSELTAVNAQLRQQIEERLRVESRLREAKKEAEHANYTKTKFLAAASHDLLQPMNAARLFSASLLEHPLEAKTRELARALNYSLEDVESLLGAVVDISKLDAGVVKPDVTAFCAQQLLNNLAHEFATLADNAGLRFRFSGTSAIVLSDSQLLARILRNLLSNAIRYTPSGSILLGCRRLARGLRIQVWDTGIGIPDSKQQEIFQEFNRIQGPGAPHDKGLGLGLAIVDKISGVLGHRIGLRSSPGRGSVFSIDVPYGDPAQLPAPQGPPLAIGNESLEGRHILVLDNEPAICDGMRTLLEGWGCAVVTAQTPRQALDRAKVPRNDGEGLDLIIADYHLDDGLNGLDAVTALNEITGGPVPVLMITANYTNELKQVVRARGYHLMNKPVRPAKLKVLLQHLLSSPGSPRRAGTAGLAASG